MARRERFLSLDGDKRAQSLPTTWPVIALETDVLRKAILF